MVLNSLKKAKQRLNTTKEQMEVVKNTCESGIDHQFERVKFNNAQIKSSLTQVFSKFELLLAEQDKTDE